MSERVLVVDDDDVGRKTLAEILTLEGFQVQEAEGGRAAVAQLERADFDVMLLDLKMPDLDGVAVLETSSRVSPDTKVIVFTAHGSLESAIQAVRHGAYDYLLKPVTSREIVACVRKAAEARREQMRARGLPTPEDELRAAQDSAASQILVAADLRLDVGRRRLECGGTAVELTPAETRLFLALYRRRGQVVAFGELVDQVQGYHVEPWEAPAMVRPVVSRLREKLRQVGCRSGRIETVRAVGYLMEER